MVQMLELEHLPIRLTALGVFLHGEVAVHPRVAVLFARHIVPQKDGAYRLEIGYDKQPLLVEDAAFRVLSLTLDGPADALRGAILHLSDASQEPLAPQTLMQSAANVLYCRVWRAGLHVAVRFSAQQYHTLAWSMQICETGYALRLAGALWPLQPYDKASYLGTADKTG